MIASNKGFTLLEVLVSIALLSLIAFSIVRITQDSTTSKIEIINEDNDLLRIHTSVSAIEKDVHHFYSPLYQHPRINTQPLRPNANATEEERQAFSEFERDLYSQFQNNRRFSGYAQNLDLIPKVIKESNHTITFLSNGYQRKNLNENKSQFSWITYTLEEPSSDDIEFLKEVHPEPDFKIGKNLVRYIDAKDPFSPEITNKDDLYPQVLMDQVINIEWSYWDRKKKGFSLLENLIDEHLPLSALKVKIEFYDLFNKEQVLEKILTTHYTEQEIQKLISKAQSKIPPVPLTEGDRE